MPDPARTAPFASTPDTNDTDTGVGVCVGVESRAAVFAPPAAERGLPTGGVPWEELVTAALLGTDRRPLRSGPSAPGTSGHPASAPGASAGPAAL
ncbi:hypothetical protein GT016_24825, partial [Streptomyces sp. SID3915]|nr:hypothetical protein [Streptomyces sp. SID3915]